MEESGCLDPHRLGFVRDLATAVGNQQRAAIWQAGTFSESEPVGEQDIPLHVAVIVNYSVGRGLVPFDPLLGDNFLTEPHGKPAKFDGERQHEAARRTADSSPVTVEDGNTPATEGGSPPAKPSEFHRYPFYSPRFWHGMRPLTWYRLLKEGRFRCDLSRLPLAVGVSAATPVNTILGTLQAVLFGRKLARRTSRTAGLYRRPLAKRHHVVARTDGA